MTENTKHILTSKTFWFNFITVVVILSNRQTEVIDPTLIEPLSIIAVPIANILLRKITKGPVTIGRSK